MSHVVPDHRRTGRLRHTSAARRSALLRLADGTRRRGDGYRPAGTRRPPAVAADVSPAVPHRPSSAAAQPPVLGRLVAQHRGAEPDTAEHAIRSEDPDDDLPRHGPRRADAVPVDHRQLDTTSLRKVGGHSVVLCPVTYSGLCAPVCRGSRASLRLDNTADAAVA